MKKFMIFLGLFLFGLIMNAQQGMSKADLKAEEAAIREISKKWLELDKNRDFKAMTDLFSEDAVLYRGNREPVKGQEAIGKYFTEQGQKNPKEVNNWSTERVDVANSGELAVEYGKFNSENSGPSGNETDKGNYITVFRKEDGKWKVVADMTNSSKTDQ